MQSYWIGNEKKTMAAIIIIGFGVSTLLSFGTDAGRSAESTSFNFCMGHTANFEVTSFFQSLPIQTHLGKQKLFSKIPKTKLVQYLQNFIFYKLSRKTFFMYLLNTSSEICRYSEYIYSRFYGFVYLLGKEKNSKYKCLYFRKYFWPTMEWGQ